MRRIVLAAIPQDEVAGQLGDQGSEHGRVRDACRGGAGIRARDFGD